MSNFNAKDLNVVCIKDVYKNIKGGVKVKELIKDKVYINLAVLEHEKPYRIVNELGEIKVYLKRNMFMKENTYRMFNRNKLLSDILDF